MTAVHANPEELTLFNQRCLRWAKSFDRQYVEIVLALASFKNLETGALFPAHQTIIAKIRKSSRSGHAPSRSTLKRRLSELGEHGVVDSKQSRGGRNPLGHRITVWRTNDYQLHFDRVVRDGKVIFHDFEEIISEPPLSGPTNTSVTHSVDCGASSGVVSDMSYITSQPTTDTTDKRTDIIPQTPPSGDVSLENEDIYQQDRSKHTQSSVDVERLVCLAEDLMEKAAAVHGLLPRVFSVEDRKILRSNLGNWLARGSSAATISAMMDVYFGDWRVSQHENVFNPAKHFIASRAWLAEKVFVPPAEEDLEPAPASFDPTDDGEGQGESAPQASTPSEIAKVFCSHLAETTGVPTVAQHVLRDWLQGVKDQEGKRLTVDDLWECLEEVAKRLGRKICTADFQNGTALGLADRWLDRTRMERNRYNPSYWV